MVPTQQQPLQYLAWQGVSSKPEGSLRMYLQHTDAAATKYLRQRLRDLALPLNQLELQSERGSGDRITHCSCVSTYRKMPEAGVLNRCRSNKGRSVGRFVVSLCAPLRVLVQAAHTSSQQLAL